MSSQTPTPPVRRTRLTPGREGELYEAVLTILCEVGYDSLTMDAVAARTHSSKATLYRRWKSKPELVASALRHCRPVRIEEIDTGSVRGDLVALAGSADEAQLERDAALARGLGHAAHSNPDLQRALRELLIDPEKTALERMLGRAVDRGEIAAGTPALDYVLHMMFGAFAARLMIEDRVPDREYLVRYIDAVVLPALGL